MKAGAEKISPEEYMLAALSPEQRLEAAFQVAREAFRDAQLTVDDVEAAVRRVRRTRYAARGKKIAGSRRHRRCRLRLRLRRHPAAGAGSRRPVRGDLRLA